MSITRRKPISSFGVAGRSRACEHITIFGDDYDTPDGTCIRDYIHVLDLADAHVLALQALEQGNRVYNLGNGEGFSVRQVIETARAVTGAAIPERVGQRRAGDPARLVHRATGFVTSWGGRPVSGVRTDHRQRLALAAAHPDGYID
ncbi:MAG: hypothetical protein CM15mP84_09730 [Cellvibrionales bacterium]|nr:MAG: hypothetical protein CM15mP84_09730 [Cellvibrionales bacterium]